MVGIATSDSPFGPFTVQNVTRMNYDTSLNASRLGEARDMTVFVDTGVDKNNDGADDAYVIYSSEMNAKLYVSLLNKDYTGLAAEADQPMPPSSPPASSATTAVRPPRSLSTTATTTC